MDTDYNRPRRPNSDTLTYLKSLPFNESLAHEEILAYINQQSNNKEESQTTPEEQQQYNHLDVDYPQNLSAALSALDEIKNEIASLAGDEFGSQCIETIARITVPYSSLAARKLLHGISGYIVHLSTHRYGSHVVQTILQNVLRGKNGLGMDEKEICAILEIDQDGDGDEHSEENKDLPKLNQALISIAEEIIPATKELAVHICGSHVLRSLLCILSGVEEELPQHLMNKGGMMDSGGNRRGKAKKKKKKKKPLDSDLTNDGMNNSASFSKYKAVTDARFDVHDSTINDCFFSLICELTGIDFKHIDTSEPIKAGDLQQLVCNPSAGPLLIVVLRILTIISTTTSKSDDDRNNLKKHDGNEEEKSIADFRLGIIEQQPFFSKDSYAEILAKNIICWDDFIVNVNEQANCGETIYGLSGETRGSHMLEILLRISNNDFYDKLCHAGKFLESDSFVEYAQHEVSNFVIQTLLNTVRTRSQAESLVKCVEGIISNGYVLKAENKRKGILWRSVEMAANFRIGQETLLKSIRKGFTSLKNDDSTSDIDKSLLEISDCVPLLIGYREAPDDGSRIGLDAIGARITYHLLRFVPRLCSDVIKGILTNFSTKELMSICNDGLGSRW